jgi:branched-chain amino acid transport system substrate-binding protein
VNIGVIEMLTGGSSIYGQAALSGIQVAVNQANAKGGVLGRHINLIVKDNASDDTQASTLTAQFAGDSSIPVAIAPTYQPNFNAACARANADSLPVVAAQSGPPDPKNNSGGWCWTMTTDPVEQATYTFTTLKQQGWSKFAIVYDQDNGYVAFQMPNIEKAAKAAGVQLESFGVSAATSTDFSAQITQAINLHADAVFPFMTIEDAARFMKQARQQGLTQPWYDPVSSLPSTRLISLSGNASKGLLGSTMQSAGDIPSFAAFVAAYKKQFGTDLADPTYAGFGYDAMNLIIKAMTDAGTTTDRAAIKAQIDKYTSACFSVCYDGQQSVGAFEARKFFMVELTSSAFVPAFP